jgi:molybdate transport system substrate-binding protein
MKKPKMRKIFLIVLPWMIGAILLLTPNARVIKQPAPASRKTIRLFAAASLSESFEQIGKLFEGENPGVRLSFNFAGSQELVLQIEQGAAADVLASADTRSMEEIQRRGLLISTPAVFARNSLTVIVPASNPGAIYRLEDLSRRGLKIVLAAENVPAGRYSREAIEKLSHTAGFPPDYATAIFRNVVSGEENVNAVVGKVMLNEADAGIVYRSDLTPAVAEHVRAIEIPDGGNVVASYPIAVLKNASDTVAANTFVHWVMSPAGQRILAEHHFIPAVNP